jgi:uncharacterized protein YciW
VPEETAETADLSPDLGTEGEPPETVGEAQAPEQAEDDGSPAAPARYTVTVDGVEEQVTLEEALANYSRQADYTRKTQALAAEREQLSHAEQLWQAIETNPESTIRAIAEAYDFKLTPAQERDLEAQRAGDEDLDPTEQRLRQVEQYAQEAQYERLQAQIDRELIAVHQRYDVKFDDDELLQFAVDRQIGDLDDAFKAFAFERMTKVAQDKRVQQRKADAPPVAGGHGVATGVVAPGPGVGQRMSFKEALAAAEAAHGI